MAKSKPKERRATPLLQVAAFCENVIQDKRDNSISAIRMVDRFEFRTNKPDEVREALRTDGLTFTQTVLFAFKTGEAKGEYSLRLVMTTPKGKRKPLWQRSLLFSGEPESGVNVTLNTNFKVKSEGLFWLDVIVEGRRLTRMPFRVVVLTLPPDEAKPAPPDMTTHPAKKKKPSGK